MGQFLPQQPADTGWMPLTVSGVMAGFTINAAYYRVRNGTMFVYIKDAARVGATIPQGAVNADLCALSIPTALLPQFDTPFATQVGLAGVTLNTSGHAFMTAVIANYGFPGSWGDQYIASYPVR